MTNALATVSLEITQGRPTTTSNVIAANFGKRHADVIRAVKKLECSDDFRQRNFALTFNQVAAPNGATRKDPAYRITRDGFVFLAMGFTGKDAALWKESYIEAFNQMEAAPTPKPTDCLLPAQKHAIKTKVASIAYKAEASQRALRFAEIYRKLKDEFQVAEYGEIPSQKFDRAISIIESFDHITRIESPKLHITAPVDFTYNEGKQALGALRNYVWAACPADRIDTMKLVDNIEKCLTSGYSRVEDAKFRLNLATSMLGGWVN